MPEDNGNHHGVGSYRHPLERVVVQAIEQWNRDRDASLSKDPRVSMVIDSWESVFTTDGHLSEERVVIMVENAADVAVRMMEIPDKSCEDNMEDLCCVLNALILPGMCELFEESLHVRLARRGIIATKAADRLCSLVQWLGCVTDVPMCVTAKAYLRIAVREYVNGSDAACIVMCASALEQTIRSAVLDDLCERLHGRKDRYAFGERVGIARDQRFFDRGSARSEKVTNHSFANAMETVWIRRNKVVHDDPAVTEKVDDTVRDTLHVIAALATGRDPLKAPWDN